jgi:hypothetical protein
MTNLQVGMIAAAAVASVGLISAQMSSKAQSAHRQAFRLSPLAAVKEVPTLGLYNPPLMVRWFTPATPTNATS